jgi:serine-type D-Ala-D-Ala carboxypeptidase (penicillin-binding protein 5/6)
LPLRTTSRRISCCRLPAAVIVSRRFFAAFIALSLLAGSLRSLSAASSFVILDSQTGYMLQEQDARKKRQIGSLTKIATAIVVLDWAEHKSGNLNQLVTLSPNAFGGTGENNIGLQPGDVISLRDLLYAALIQSDNIAAYSLADYVGSVVPAVAAERGGQQSSAITNFVAQVNALAKQLKMEGTRFVNPHGIDENVKPLPYSTAEDMARLTRYAMSKASFRFYVAQKERQITFQRGPRKLGYLLRNTNELLGARGIDGVKTGRTARAGDCIILSATREPEVVKEGAMTAVYPRHLLIILLGGSNRFDEGAALVDRGWQLYDQWAAAGRMADPKKLLQ